MSTYSIPITGPSPRLAMLRALALKTARRTGELLATVRVVLTRSRQLVRAAATTVLGAIGSDTGYQLARHGVRALARVAVTAARAVGRAIGRATRTVGRLLRAGISLISPAAAAIAEQAVHQYLTVPLTVAATTASSWVRDAAQVLWELTDTALVRTTTVRSAQIAAATLAVHSLTQGLAATKVVQAVPALMDIVVTLTNPAKALLLVGVAFTTALGVAAFRLLDDGHWPDPQDPHSATEFVTTEAEAPQLLAEPRTTGRAVHDLERIAAQVNIEVTPDGSVLVHGIPCDLPEEIGLEVAHIAADAATARLEKVLLHRPIPNRDDRRLLTKTAREALRAEGRRKARAAA